MNDTLSIATYIAAKIVVMCWAELQLEALAVKSDWILTAKAFLAGGFAIRQGLLSVCKRVLNSSCE